MGCRWLEAILAVVIIVFAYWPTMIWTNPMWSEWVVIVSAALLLLHALFCMKCKGVCSGLLSGSRGRSRSRRR